jgi:tripartite-type tricarboxylate transporter receptor subunit TctC
MPETPTVSESLPGFLTGSFQGLLAPAGTPKAVIDKLHAEIQRIAALPEIKERLTALGAEPSGMTPDQFAQWMRLEIPAMAKIVKDEKITLE